MPRHKLDVRESIIKKEWGGSDVNGGRTVGGASSMEAFVTPALCYRRVQPCHQGVDPCTHSDMVARNPRGMGDPACYIPGLK